MAFDYDDDEHPSQFTDDSHDDEEEGESDKPLRKGKEKTDTSDTSDEAEEELVNTKRGYTASERDMIAEWLKKNKPKTDDSLKE